MKITSTFSLHNIIVFTRNIEKSLSFYVSVFGFQILNNSPKLVEISDCKKNFKLLIKEVNKLFKQ